jgi:predicted AAA+ superfamily ATPase
MKMIKYLNRIIDTVLKQELKAFGAVLITGPKWCGKTTTAKRITNSVLYMQNPDRKKSYMSLAELQPSLLLRGDNPRLIDEWQMAPQLWDAIRFDVDSRNKTGLYILTGSSTIDEDKISHSGAGRISRMKMRTMSLYESLNSTGQVSLIDLFDANHDIEGLSELDIKDIAKLIVRGGWPGNIEKPLNIARRSIEGYCDIITTSEIKTVDGIERDEAKTRNVLRSLARHTSSTATNATILRDIQANHSDMHRNTLSDYLNALRKLHIIEDLPAWSPKLRSKTVIRTSNKRHLVDPAISTAILKASPKDLIYDINTFGLLFESLVIRDLRVYTQALGGSVSHYQDSSGLEADAVIHLNDGRWGLVEVKLGDNSIDEAAKNLKEINRKIDTTNLREPSFLMIVTGIGYAYKRDDDVLVVPIGCLKH